MMDDIRRLLIEETGTKPLQTGLYSLYKAGLKSNDIIDADPQKYLNLISYTDEHSAEAYHAKELAGTGIWLQNKADVEDVGMWIARERGILTTVGEYLKQPRQAAPKNWLQKIAQADEYPFSTVEYQGRKFETGVPVEFRSLHNREKSPNFGSQFQQDIEPAGRYMIHQESPGDLSNSIYNTEISKFSNPLVIEFNVDDDSSYNEHSWKAFLSRKFGGLTGKELSKAIAKVGYDGIVTVKKQDGVPVDTSEIVDLRMFHLREKIK